MSNLTFREKLKYRFENSLSAGPIAIIGWLALISFVIVLLAGSAIVLFKIPTHSETGESWGFLEAIWNSLMRAIDAGNLAGDEGWKLRIVSGMVTLGGIFIVAILIGTITSGIEASIEEMRKGRSRVIESNHTLILGWSPKIFSIISELIIANENLKRAHIVILADMDKVEMEDQIRSKFPSTKNTKIICRHGSPLDLDDLKIANPNEAKSIIILSPEDTDHPDTYVIKSILALTNNPERKSDKFHIVAEFREEKNLEAGSLVGGDEASLILSSDLIARVTAQTCRQSGLSMVYTELMDFDGAEIYFKEEPQLVGKTYREVLNAYEDSTVMGIMNRDQKVHINPKMETLFNAGDQVIAISEDDDTLVLNTQTTSAINLSAIRNRSIGENVKERTLILGWNEKAISIINELDHYVANDSHILIVSDDADCEGELQSIQQTLNRQKLEYRIADFTSKAIMEDIKPQEFDHIILLCSNKLPVQEADAQVLISLLHLRNLSDTYQKDFSIVSEMRDFRNRALAEIAKADDFIVSDKLVSLLLSQISENKHLFKVFSDLFAAEGSEIYIRDIEDYIELDVEVNFYTLLEAAARKGETAIGYKILKQASDADKAYGVVCNPKKSQVLRFEKGDKIIVLAED